MDAGGGVYEYVGCTLYVYRVLPRGGVLVRVNI
jgi:hypothetical protein